MALDWPQMSGEWIELQASARRQAPKSEINRRDVAPRRQGTDLQCRSPFSANGARF